MKLSKLKGKGKSRNSWMKTSGSNSVHGGEQENVGNKGKGRCSQGGGSGHSQLKSNRGKKNLNGYGNANGGKKELARKISLDEKSCEPFTFFSSTFNE